MILLVGSTQDVVELHLIDLAEISIRILEEKVTDPVCADWERITLAVLVLRVTLGGCQTLVDWVESRENGVRSQTC